WDRAELWDPCRIQLALAYALLARWTELEGMLPDFDGLAAKGAPLLSAFAAALREEIAAATLAGPAPAHRELRALGYLGFSHLLSYRRACDRCPSSASTSCRGRTCRPTSSSTTRRPG